MMPYAIISLCLPHLIFLLVEDIGILLLGIGIHKLTSFIFSLSIPEEISTFTSSRSLFITTYCVSFDAVLLLSLRNTLFVDLMRGFKAGQVVIVERSGPPLRRLLVSIGDRNSVKRGRMLSGFSKVEEKVSIEVDGVESVGCWCDIVGLPPH